MGLVAKERTKSKSEELMVIGCAFFTVALALGMLNGKKFEIFARELHGKPVVIRVPHRGVA